MRRALKGLHLESAKRCGDCEGASFGSLGGAEAQRNWLQDMFHICFTYVSLNSKAFRWTMELDLYGFYV